MIIKRNFYAFLSGAILVSLVYLNGSAKESGDTAAAVRRPPGPEWIDRAVFYQIYPQTFYDSDSDGIGDLQGIIEKLDYVKSLGISAVWLNPFYESPFRDAGYDVTDFYKVAPRYGTNDDAKRLFAEIHKRGMHVIMDYVPSYTSLDHPWFKASCDPKPNRYTNWYVWTNATWFPDMEKYRTNFIQGYCERDGMFMNNFFWHQPALNYGYAHPDPNQTWQLPTDHPDVMEMKKEMQNVMKFWLDMGCDGFRVDMAGAMVKNDDGTETGKYWKSVREMLDREYPGTFLVAEWSSPKDAVRSGFNADFFHWFKGYDDLFQKENFRNSGQNGHSFFDNAGKGDISNFMKIYMDQYEACRGRGYIAVPFGNHDLIRIKNNGRTDRDIAVIFAFMMTMPGTPFIYYGDEIGMRQLDGLPHIEGCYGGRAGDRSPMQWDKGQNKGFSGARTDKLYRMYDTSAKAPDVLTQEKDPSSLLSKVKELIRLRSAEPAIAAYADFIPIYAENHVYPFVYMRMNGKERLLVAINPAGRNVSASFDIPFDSLKPELISGNGRAKMQGHNITLSLEGAAYAIFRINGK